MHKFQLNRAVKIAGEMIKAFYIKGDVEKVLSYINSNNFTWIGGSVDQILTNIEDVRKFFYRFVDVIRESLDFLSEDYQVVASSEDSCIIVAKIILKDKQHSNQVKLFFSFYFQIVDKKILCSSYHVHHLDLNCGSPLYQFVYNDEIKIDSPRLDMTKIATKGFLLEDCLPYIYINLQFIELIGYKRLQNFIAMSQKSSLSQIHPADQSRYVEVLNRCRSKSKDQNSYFVSYRTQSPEQIDQDSSQVFEWGMISKVDDRFVVNALVFPIEEVDEIKNSDSSFFFELILGGGGNFYNLSTIAEFMSEILSSYFQGSGKLSSMEERSISRPRNSRFSLCSSKISINRLSRVNFTNRFGEMENFKSRATLSPCTSATFDENWNSRRIHRFELNSFAARDID